MKNKVVFIFLFVIAFIAGSFNVMSAYSNHDENSPFVKQFLEEANAKHYGNAVRIFNRFNSSEKDEVREYIEKNPTALPPCYFMFMADHIYKKDKNLALRWYYIGKFRSFEDANLCADSTATAQVSFYPSFAPKTVKYLKSKIKNKEYVAKILQNALDWDKNHTQRPDPKWACYHGMSIYSGEPELIESAKFDETINKVRNDIQNSINQYKKK